MQVDSPDKIRNITITGHGDTGKTTLASALLYTGGVANRLNRVEDGNAVTDFDPEEISRSMSIGLGLCHVPWQKHKINIIDTPGAGIFGAETRSGARIGDAMLLVIDAGSGIEVTTEKMWDWVVSHEQPLMIHINKLDRENTDYARTVVELRERFGRLVRPLQLPIGKEGKFHGVVDLLEEKAYFFEPDGNGQAKPGDIPDDLTDRIEQLRGKLVEAIAETNDELLERYFEEGELSPEDLHNGLRNAVRTGKIVPVTAGSAVHGIGSSTLLDSIVRFLPTPLDRATYPATDIGGDDIELATTADERPSALVFKTLNDPFSGKINLMRVISGTIDSDTAYWNSRAEDTEKVGQLLAYQGKQGTPIKQLITGDIGGVAKLKHTQTGDTLCGKDQPLKLEWTFVRPPAISYAIEPKSKGDEEKINDALHRLMEEDLSLASGRDPQTGEVLISGTGQLHVEIAVAKLANRYKVDVILHPPKVPYRETIKRPADGHGRHKKQSGGRGQFADCKITMEPLTDGTDFEFKDQIFGGSIPQQYRPAVEKGIHEARERGFLAGYPVGGFMVRLLDGQYHDVDSSEMAFKVAGSLAFKDAMSKADATIHEPIMQVEITTSEECTGDLMSDLSQRRGRPQGIEPKGNNQIIKAAVPLAEMLDYSSSLRSITQGRSNFVMEFSHYEEVPRNIQQKIIAEAQRGDDAEAH
ncbi:MAG: elongation factor G [Acidobacteriota bacterium]